MDNTPITSVNSELISAGLNPNNPTDTYVDFAEQMAKNRQEQDAQEQAIALARERVKQAQFQTGTEAPESMTPEEAAAYLKIVAQAKGLDIDQPSIDAWVQTLPPRVNRQVVESFANRFARESTRTGQPAEFGTNDKIAIPAGSTAADLGLVADKTDPMVGHVPEDGMYQVVYDNQGNIKKFIPGGKEAPDTSAKAKQHGEDEDRKDWKALGVQLTKAFTTRSGGLGSISTAIFRATRAINTLNNYKDNLTAQDLENIAQDIGAIFQGGAATVESAKGNNYSTLFTDFQNTFRKYTGWLIPTNQTVIKDTTDKMMQVLVDLRESAIENIDKYAEFQSDIFNKLVAANPEQWAKVKKHYIDLASSGLLIPPGENTHMTITGADIATPTKESKKSEKSNDGGLKIPSADEIKAERARRNSGKK